MHRPTRHQVVTVHATVGVTLATVMGLAAVQSATAWWVWLATWPALLAAGTALGWGDSRQPTGQDRRPSSRPEQAGDSPIPAELEVRIPRPRAEPLPGGRRQVVMHDGLGQRRAGDVHELSKNDRPVG